MVPLNLLSHCTYSVVLDQIDLGTGHEDHRAVGVQVQWNHHTCHKHKTPGSASVPREHIKNNEEIRTALGAIAVPPWACDIESQVAQCNGAIQKAIQRSTPPKQTRPKKHYIAGEVWDNRQEKNRSKHKVSSIDAARRREDLRLFVQAWRGMCYATTEAVQRHFPSGYSCLLSCHRLKHGIHIAILARRIKDQLKTYKKAFVEQTIAQVPDTASASQILTLMKPCIGTSNSRKRSRPCLPHVLDAEGNPCLSVEEARNRWIEFFAAMEGGSRTTAEEQRKLWIENLTRFRATSFECDISQLPTLLGSTCLQVDLTLLGCSTA